MPTELWVALVGVGGTILAGVAGGLIALYAPDWKAQRDRRRQVQELEARYSDSLLRAADDLQSRLYNIVQQKFLSYVRLGTEDESFHALASTVWLVGQYFGWVLLLRRDAHSLALGGVARGKELLSLLNEIDALFATDRFGRSFRLWRAQQSAVAEVMIIERTADDVRRFDCLGYSSCVDRLGEQSFARWFEPLKEGLDVTGIGDPPLDRLSHLQNALLDLAEFLYGGPIPGRERLPLDEA